MKYTFNLQNIIVKHCVTGIKPSLKGGGILHKLMFRISIKGEIKWGK